MVSCKITYVASVTVQTYLGYVYNFCYVTFKTLLSFTGHKQGGCPVFV